jgi:peptide/nickel transport system permease protein
MAPFQLLPVLFGISVLVFVMVRSIPGDPARILLGVRSTPTGHRQHSSAVRAG